MRSLRNALGVGVVGFMIGLFVLTFSISQVQAQIVDLNTLHVFCTSPTPTCLDNGTITPTSTNPPTFGFIRSPNSNTNLSSPETITLEFLIPSNESVAFGTVTGTNTGISTPVSPILHSGTWTTGDLLAFLSLTQTGGPNNPIGAYLPSTKLVDPTATGYSVYQANFGTVSFSSTTDPTFITTGITGGFPVGTVILALVEGPGTNNVQDATANSGALIIDSPGGTISRAPAPAALLLLGSGLVGLWGLNRRKAAK